MTRLVVRGLALGLLVAGPASACLNDKELPGHEREFRSNYNGRVVAPPETPPPPPEYTPILQGGAALLVASAGLVLIRGRRRG